MGPAKWQRPQNVIRDRPVERPLRPQDALHEHKAADLEPTPLHHPQAFERACQRGGRHGLINSRDRQVGSERQAPARTRAGESAASASLADGLLFPAAAMLAHESPRANRRGTSRVPRGPPRHGRWRLHTPSATLPDLRHRAGSRSPKNDCTCRLPAAIYLPWGKPPSPLPCRPKGVCRRREGSSIATNARTGGGHHRVFADRESTYQEITSAWRKARP